MNKKAVSMVIVYMIIGLIVILFAIPLVKYINKTSDASMAKEWGIAPGDDFKPYDYGKGLSEDDKTTVNSMKALVCTLSLVSDDEAASKSNCVTPKATASDATGKVVDANAQKSFTCPDGSYDYGTSCVTCSKDANGKNRCTISNFQMPQEDASESWIKGMGDPNYIIYSQSFPKGEDNYWRVDQYSLNPTFLLISAGLTLVMPVDAGMKDAAEAIAKKASFSDVLKSSASSFLENNAMINFGKKVTSPLVWMYSFRIDKNKIEEAMIVKNVLKSINTGEAHLSDDALNELSSILVKGGGKGEVNSFLKRNVPSYNQYLYEARLNTVSDSIISSYNEVKANMNLYRQNKKLLDTLSGFRTKSGELSPTIFNEFFKNDLKRVQSLSELVDSGKLSAEQLQSLRIILRDNDNLFSNTQVGVMSNSISIQENILSGLSNPAVDAQGMKAYADAFKKLYEKVTGMPYVGPVVKLPENLAKISDPALNDYRILSMVAIGFYSQKADSFNENLIGKSSVSLVLSNSLGASNDVNLDFLMDTPIMLIKKGDKDRKRFHLVSPCKANIEFYKTNDYNILNSPQYINIYDSGKGIIPIENGPVYTPPNQVLAFSSAEISDYIKNYNDAYTNLQNGDQALIDSYASSNNEAKILTAISQYNQGLTKLSNLPNKFFYPQNRLPSNLKGKDISGLYDDLYSQLGYAYGVYESFHPGQTKNVLFKQSDKFTNVDLTTFHNYGQITGNIVPSNAYGESIWGDIRGTQCNIIGRFIRNIPVAYGIKLKTPNDFINEARLTNTDVNTFYSQNYDLEQDFNNQLANLCKNTNIIPVPSFLLKKQTNFHGLLIPSVISKTEFINTEQPKLIKQIESTDINSVNDYESLYTLKDYYEYKSSVYSRLFGKPYIPVKDFDKWLIISKKIQKNYPSMFHQENIRYSDTLMPDSKDFESYLDMRKFSSEKILAKVVRIGDDNNYCYHDNSATIEYAKKATFFASMFADDFVGTVAATWCGAYTGGIGAAGCYKAGAIATNLAMAGLQQTLNKMDMWPGTSVPYTESSSLE